MKQKAMKTLSIYIGIIGILLLAVLPAKAASEAEFRKLSKTYTLRADGSQEVRVQKELTLFTHAAMNSLYGENGYTLTVDPVSLSLNIDITDDRYDQVKLFYDFIWDVIPAHIYIPAKQYSGTSIDTPLCAGVVPSSTVMSYLTGTY